MAGTMTTPTNRGPRRTHRLAHMATTLAVVAGAALALSASPALGAYGHTLESEFPIGSECLTVQDIAVLEPEGLVYVSCRVGTYPNEADQILRFKLNGEPAPFSASAPYISGQPADRRPRAPKTETSIITRTSPWTARAP